MADEVFKNILTPQETEIIDNQPSEKDMWMAEVSKQIFSKDDIEVKTDINTAQINALTKGKLFAKTFNCSIMDDLCEQIMLLSVSKDRRSRKEFTEISKNQMFDNNQIQQPSISQRLLG